MELQLGDGNVLVLEDRIIGIGYKCP